MGGVVLAESCQRAIPSSPAFKFERARWTTARDNPVKCTSSTLNTSANRADSSSCPYLSAHCQVNLIHLIRDIYAHNKDSRTHVFEDVLAMSDINQDTIDISIPTPGLYLNSTRPTRKSHAKKKPAGHIPRPRNAFILFRCDFVEQQSVPASVENNHRNISRMAGKLWQTMSKESRLPWVELAHREKLEHAQKYPGYRYAPISSVSTHPKKRQNATARKSKSASPIVVPSASPSPSPCGWSDYDQGDGVDGHSSPTSSPAYYSSAPSSPTSSLPTFSSPPPSSPISSSPAFASPSIFYDSLPAFASPAFVSDFSPEFCLSSSPLLLPAATPFPEVTPLPLIMDTETPWTTGLEIMATEHVQGPELPESGVNWHETCYWERYLFFDHA